MHDKGTEGDNIFFKKTDVCSALFYNPSSWCVPFSVFLSLLLSLSSLLHSVMFFSPFHLQSPQSSFAPPP